jgi:hypothetical protein
VDGDIGRSMKHLLKQSSSTKLKALQELLDTVTGGGDVGGGQRERQGATKRRTLRREGRTQDTNVFLGFFRTLKEVLHPETSTQNPKPQSLNPQPYVLTSEP